MAQRDSIILIGETVYLKEFHIEDSLSNYIKWMEDQEVLRYTDSRYSDNSIEKLKEYVMKISKDPDSLLFAISWKQNYKHIGNIKIGPIDRIHGTASIGILIGEKSYWGKGCGTEAIRLVSDYALNVLKVRKLTAGCVEENQGAIRAFKKAGFNTECVRKRHRVFDSTEHDVVMLCRFRDEQ